MDTLKDTIKSIIAEYAGKAGNGHTFMTVSPNDDLFTVVGIGNMQGKRFATTSLIAHLIGNQIVIERDVNDKPLMDALLQAGIPRHQIILAYAGEPVPEAVV